MALKNDFTLWVWGQNIDGRLGTGDKVLLSSPTQVGIATDWRGIEANFANSFAWRVPQVTTTPSPTPSPSPSPSPTPIPSATAGYYGYSTGRNSNGQLGIGVGYNVSIPTAIDSSSTWILLCPSAASSTASGAGIKNDFSLWLWGCATNGQLGNNVGNALINYSSPIQTSLGGFDWISVGLGYRSGWAVKLNGTLWSWGTNANGTIGNNQAAVAYSTPIQIGTDTDWASVYGGNGTTAYALKKDGTLWGWGRNEYGQLGDSTIVSRSSPTQIGAGKTFTKFAASGIHCGAVDSTGALWMWGINQNGCLGNENVINYSSMVQTVYATNNWLSVGCGHNNSGRQFTIALKTDGTLWTWGSNNASQLGSGNFVNRSSPAQILGGGTNWTYITAGVQSGFAIKNDNTMWVWGRNQVGELGNNSVVSLNSPTQLNFGANDYVLTAAGYDAMMLLKPTYITPQPTPSPLPTSTPTPTPT
jgi:alpha-tubulin suppressor-like RCC1 family protein